METGIQPRYIIRLADVQELAYLATVADDLKNFVPPEFEITSEAARLSNRAHTILQRVLGADVARVYGPPEEPEDTRADLHGRIRQLLYGPPDEPEDTRADELEEDTRA